MYKVYYTDPIDNKCYNWDCDVLSDALSVTETFRKRGMSFVTMVSENPNQIGKTGVDSVENGLCPDGIAYTWRKRRK
jgi:microsomal dipeptidase-like Zn-dependent dipeptidase